MIRATKAGRLQYNGCVGAHDGKGSVEHAVAQTHETIRCGSCGRETLHVRDRPHHLLHLTLSVMTFGIWLPVWGILGLTPDSPQCTECGSFRAHET